MPITPEFGEPIVFTVKCELCGKKVATEDVYTIDALGDEAPLCIDCFMEMQVA